MLDPGRGRTKKGYFWAIARDDRPWGGTDPPAIAYSYAPGRGAVHASEAARSLSRHRAVRRIRGLQDHRRQSSRRGDHARLLLGASAPPVLRHRQGRRRADRQRGARAHRCALSRSRRRSAAASADERRAVRQEKSKPLVLGAQGLARASAHTRLGQVADRRGHPLWLEPLGRAHPLPRRRPHRARHQHRRARHPSHRAQSQERALRRS